MSDFIESAISKIEKELANIKGESKYAAAVKHETAEALISFCRQNDEIAQAIVQSDKTLGDCLNHIMRSVGSSISDIEVYRRAVQFYFPGAEIRMEMRVFTCKAEAEDAEENTGIILNLADFL